MPYRRRERASISKILLVRGDGIGDALALAPLVAALRDAGHELSAVLGPANAAAYAGGVFARTHVLERIPWPAHGSTPVSYRTALAAARPARYDIALIASEEPEAYRFAQAARIPRRVGFLTGFEKPLKTLALRWRLTRVHLRTASAVSAREHEVETLFRLGEGLHAEPEPTRDVVRLRPLVTGTPACRDGTVVVQFGPRDARGPEALRGFALLARAVSTAYDAVLTGAEADRAALAALAADAGCPYRTYDSVRDWIDALAQSRAVVTFDGGGAHVAGTTGVPCVDLFTATPQTAADVRRWHPWAAAHRTIVAGPAPERTAEAALAALAALIGEPI